MGIDPATGRHAGTVAIAPTHAGGIGMTMGWAFVQGTGNTIRKYKLSQLATKMQQAGTPYLKQIGKARKVHSADFMSSYADDTPRPVRASSTRARCAATARRAWPRGIAEYDGNAFLVFESGAAQYVAKHPLNQIGEMHKATIAALTR